MKQLKSVLNKVNNKHISGIKRFILIKKYWNKNFSENLTNNCQPVKITKYKLTLATSSPVWTHKLNLNKLEIINQISKSKIKINDINFTISSTQEVLKIKRESDIVKSQHETKSYNNYKKLIKPTHNLNIDQLIHSLKNKAVDIKKSRIKQGWKICSNCGRLLKISEETCLFCLNEIKQNKGVIARKLLSEVPWVKYKDSNLKNVIDEKTFIGVKEGLQSKARNQLFYLSVNHHEKVNPEKIYQIANFYVSLKTGLSPLEMTDTLIKKTLGKKFSEVVFKS